MLGEISGEGSLRRGEGSLRSGEGTFIGSPLPMLGEGLGVGAVSEPPLQCASFAVLR